MEANDIVQDMIVYFLTGNIIEQRFFTLLGCTQGFEFGWKKVFGLPPRNLGVPWGDSTRWAPRFFFPAKKEGFFKGRPKRLLTGRAINGGEECPKIWWGRLPLKKGGRLYQPSGGGAHFFLLGGQKCWVFFMKGEV